jgi:hypothetical protein
MTSFEPSGASIFDRLTALRNGLLRLHKSLLDSERALYERDIAQITSSGQLLDLVLNNPSFAWLRDISRLVVEIDETIDSRKTITTAQVELLISRTRSLLAASENGNGFHRSYYEAFQRDPDTVIAHGEMMKVLAGLKS